MKKLHIVGDVHLGRKFENGVPLHRKGDREKMVWEQFERELNVSCEIHIQTGDLYDSFIVPNEVVLKTFELYKAAAAVYQSTLFVIYRGNHDASRNESRASSFDIFERLCEGIENILVVKDKPSVINGYAFLPWHPFKTSHEMATELSSGDYEAVFGHWETSGFNGDTSNEIPYEALKGKTQRIFTGHIHKPHSFHCNGFAVTVVGSMQPYAHGEEVNDDLYQTVHLSDLKDTSIYKNKCLRIICKRDDEIPEIDCLSLTFKYVEENVSDEAMDIEVEFEEFDMNKIFLSCLSEAGVREDIIDIITSKFQELKKC